MLSEGSYASGQWPQATLSDVIIISHCCPLPVQPQPPCSCQAAHASAASGESSALPQGICSQQGLPRPGRQASAACCGRHHGLRSGRCPAAAAFTERDVHSW